MINERLAIEKAILEKVWKDPNFRSELKANPKAALAKMNLELPDNLEIEVMEEQPNKVILVIPHDQQEAALSDDELKSVAGGGSWSSSTGFGQNWSGYSKCCITGSGC